MGGLLTTGCWLSLYIALGSLLLAYFPSAPTKEETISTIPKKHTDTVVPRLKSDGLVNCTSLEELTDLEWIASGWTKAVYKGRFRGRDIAVKTVNLDGHDIESCLSRPERPSLARCYRRASAKILRELILLQELDHPNVIKITLYGKRGQLYYALYNEVLDGREDVGRVVVSRPEASKRAGLYTPKGIIEVLGSCIPDAVGPVVIATELGEPLDSVHLLQLTWQERIKVAYSVASLLHHLAHSSLGSLAVTDLKRQQFVLVDGQLKLADVDDLGISEPTCTFHTDCTPPRDEFNIIDPEPVFCVGGRCEGHNERSNILRAGIDFVPHVLPLSAPASLEPHIREIVEAYQGLHHWDSSKILEATRALITSSS